MLSFVAINWHRCWPRRAFSLTWPASMQIYWNKRKPLHKKRVQLPQDCPGAPTWPPFHCFRTPIWPPWRLVKTLYWATSRKIQIWKIQTFFTRIRLPSTRTQWIRTPKPHCFETVLQMGWVVQGRLKITQG